MKRIYIINELDIKSLLKEEGFSNRFINKYWLHFHFLITRILFKYYRKSKANGTGFVMLNSDMLINSLGRVCIQNTPWKRYSDSEVFNLYSIIRDLLQKWGVILYYKHWKPDVKSEVYYKITDEWYDRGFKLFRGDIPDKISHGFDSVSSVDVSTYDEVYQVLYKDLMKVKLDKERALRWLGNAYQNNIPIKEKKVQNRWVSRTMDLRIKNLYEIYIDQFENDKYFIVTDTGRCYNFLTNFPSMLRQFLYLEAENGERQQLIEDDVKNCQPYLLTFICPDSLDQQYVDLTREGKFYDYLKTKAIESGIPVNDQFKIDLFGSVFFSEEKRRSKLSRLFEQEFPDTYSAITQIKSGDYKRLSKLLQKKESDLIIHGITKQLQNEGVPVVTIHDAVYTTRQHQSRVVTLINEIFYSGSELMIAA